MEGVPASHPWDSDEEDELDTHSRDREGVPILGHALVESRWIEDPLFSVLPTVPASTDATVGGRPRQSERSHDASIVATQADNDIDADDERHPPVPEDVVNALESDLAVEGDRSAEENTPVVSTVPASSGAVRRRLVLVGGGRRVVLVPQSAGTPQSVQDVFESDDADEESRAVVNHFDMTVGDSDLSVDVTPRHHLGVGSTQPTRLDSPSANRFAALRDDDDPFAEDSSNESERPIDHPEFVDEIQDVPSLPSDDPVAQVRRPQGEVIQDITVNPAIRAALRSLDEVDVQHLFRDRAVVIKSLPSLIRGPYKSAMRMALREAADRASARDEVGLCRAWKLFLLLPRMLLHRPPRGVFIPKCQLSERFAWFSRGQ